MLDCVHRAIPATSSNFSYRTKPHEFLVSRSGLHKRDLSPGDFLRLDISGEKVFPLSPKPSDEALLHAAVYQLFPQARCVLHCHAPCFESLVVPERILSGHEILKAIGTPDHKCDISLPVFLNTQDMFYLSQQVIDYFKKVEVTWPFAFVIERHGVYCFGNSVEKAINHLEVLLHLL
jgi:methylthioribulose-1-phosphate dehydratase